MERQHRRAASARILYVRRAGESACSPTTVRSLTRCAAAEPIDEQVGWERTAGGGAHALVAECLALEGLTLTQQIRTIAASNVMVGVHGQAMAWMPFMLSEQSRAAVVEVLMPKLPGTKSVSNPRMYAHFASAMRINHTAIWCTRAGMHGHAEDVLGCNVTVSVGSVLAALEHAVAHVQGSLQ